MATKHFSICHAVNRRSYIAEESERCILWCVVALDLAGCDYLCTRYTAMAGDYQEALLWTNVCMVDLGILGRYHTYDYGG